MKLELLICILKLKVCSLFIGCQPDHATATYFVWILLFFNFLLLHVDSQLDHLQHEADRLADEKPEEAAVIKEKVVLLTDIWQELKQMVSHVMDSVALTQMLL